MEKSRFVRRNDDFVNTPEIARPYFVDTDNGTLIPVRPELPIRATTLTAAGGLLSSANDMEKYLRLHMNFGNLDGKQIVAEVSSPHTYLCMSDKPAEIILQLRK